MPHLSAIFKTLKSAFTFAAGLFLQAQNAAFADVVMRPMPQVSGITGGSKEYIQIEGNISAKDPYLLLLLLPKWGGAIALNSPGGDVKAAMELGRLLRRENRDAFVGPAKSAVCASACVLTLAGAPSKIIMGKVGIHRPYVPDDKISDPTGQKLRYEALEIEIKSYLREMNVNPQLFDDMMRIPPSNVRYLTKVELERYGLSGTDPYVDEANLTNSANLLRISKQELLSRRSRIAAECKTTISKEYGQCHVAIEYGISIEEYRARDKRAQQECAASPNRIAWVQCHTKITRGF